MIIWKTCSDNFIDNVVTLRLKTLTGGDNGWTGRGGSPRSRITKKTKKILLCSFYIIKSNHPLDTKRPTSYTKYMVNYRHMY